MQPNEQVLVAISALKIADRNQWTDENFPSVSCAIGNRENPLLYIVLTEPAVKEAPV